MSQCDYWVRGATEQWCEIKSDLCNCDGCDERCSMKGSVVTTALQQAERITLKEAAQRVRRNKRAQEAS